MPRTVFAETPFGEVSRITEHPYTFVACVVRDGKIKHTTYTKGTEADARKNATQWDKPGTSIHVYPVKERK